MTEQQKQIINKGQEWIQTHREEFVAELQTLTRIPSVSRADLAEEHAPFGPECRRVLDHMLKRGEDYGFSCEDHDGYAGSIYMGSQADPIGIFTHLDVVPAGDGWIYPPFDAIYLPEHDAIIGRGCDDNKCVSVAMLFLLRMLRDLKVELKHGIRLVCGTSEETGMQDMTALLAKGMQFPRLSLVPDTGFPVNYGQKGSVSSDIATDCSGNLLAFDGGVARNSLPDHAEAVLALPFSAVASILDTLDPTLLEGITAEPISESTKLIAQGKAAHAASPQSGINALFRLSRVLTESKLLTGSAANAIEALYRLTADTYGSKEGVAYSDSMSGPLTLVYSVAHLAEGKLTVSTDCRTPITTDVEVLTKSLCDFWTSQGFTVLRTSPSKPYYRPIDDPYVQALQKVFKEVTNRDDEPFVMGGGNYARVIPNALSFGPGMPTQKKISDFLPHGHGGCHAPDEAVIMEKAHNCALIYLAAIMTLDDMI